MTEETNIFTLKANKTKYSKYAFSLERLFKNNSLNHLQDKLKHPRVFKSKDDRFDEQSNSKLLKFKLERKKHNEILNIKQKIFNYNSLDKQRLNSKEPKSIDKNVKTVGLSNEYESGLSFKQLIEISRKDKIRRQKELNNESPDVWKYNPNYDIKFKKSPKIKFPPIKQSYDKNQLKTEVNDNNDKLNSSVISNLSNQHHQRESVSLNNSIHLSPQKQLNRKNSIISQKEIIKKIQLQAEKEKERDKSNKALRFSKYLNRKDYITSITQNIPYMPSNENL